MVSAILKEIELRQSELSLHTVDTIYFGGGTPSLLENTQLEEILNTIAKKFKLANSLEITLEANPDDIDQHRLQAFQNMGINRLSVGIQSFFDEDLIWMNRVHKAEDSIKALDLIGKAGFNSVSIDLIYGSPTTSDEMWQLNVERALTFPINHISPYCLTVEPNTLLQYRVNRGLQQPIDEQKAQLQYQFLIDKLNEEGWLHYEISNFCKPNSFSKHNTSYWKGTPYLGIGPAAHSFDGDRKRQWNISNNPLYINSVENGLISNEFEILTDDQIYNEWIMTSLRTMWGCRKEDLMVKFTQFKSHFEKIVPHLIKEQLVIENEESFVLHPKAKFFADGIAVKLFI